MACSIVPLTTNPQQNFKITLPIDGKNLTFFLTIRYNGIAQYWWMSIFDSNNNLLLDSIPLVTGNYPAANILQQYQYMNIGSAYVINVANSSNIIPDTSDLGTDFILIFTDTYPTSSSFTNIGGN